MKKNSREAGLKKKKNSRKLIKLIGMNYLSIFGSYCTMDYHILTNNLNIALQLKNSMWDMRVMMTSARRWRVTAKWMNLQWSEKNLSIQIDFFFWKLWWIENIKLVTLWLYKINSAFFLQMSFAIQNWCKIAKVSTSNLFGESGTYFEG